jgi:hypothetical protein
MSEEIKETIKDKVTRKMGLAKYFMEMYFQIYDLVANDPRYSKLPNYLQNSVITTIFIATKETIDKNRVPYKSLDDLKKSTEKAVFEESIQRI